MDSSAKQLLLKKFPCEYACVTLEFASQVSVVGHGPHSREQKHSMATSVKFLFLDCVFRTIPATDSGRIPATTSRSSPVTSFLHAPKTAGTGAAV